MCLYITKDSKRLKASEDIICYKYIIKLGNYITPYRKMPVSIGSTYESRLIKNKSGEINLGLHSVCGIENLYDICKYNRQYIPVKCVIPKGSWYYQGKFGVYSGYASTKIIYQEIIDMCDLKESIRVLEELRNMC